MRHCGSVVLPRGPAITGGVYIVARIWRWRLHDNEFARRLTVLRQSFFEWPGLDRSARPAAGIGLRRKPELVDLASNLAQVGLLAFIVALASSAFLIFDVALNVWWGAGFAMCSPSIVPTPSSCGAIAFC